MLLKRLKFANKKLSVRLTMLYATVLIACLGSGLLALYFLMSHSLRGRDHDVIEAKAKEYLVFYENEGVEGLRQKFAIADEKDKDRNFFVKVIDKNGQTLFSHMPLNIDRFDMNNGVSKGHWIRFPVQNDEDALEVLVSEARDDNILQVGKSTEFREGQLEDFQMYSAFIIFVFVVIGMIVGFIISNRALTPIRELVSTIKELTRGDVSARVKVNNSGDELDDLGRLFNDMLKKNEKLISGMRESLDNISHDLRTPMTRFRCTAELALQKDSSKEQLLASLVDAVEESDQILSTLNTLLDVSEAQAQSIQLKRELIDLSQIANEVVDLYDFVAEEKNISVKTNLIDNLRVFGDAVRIRRAVANLLDNAIKYTPSGGSVTLVTSLDGGHAVLSVTDTGIGINESELPHIWDRLYRGDQSRSERGLGLGLSLVKAIVELHQGIVQVKSQPKTGSSFSILLPIQN